MLSLGWYPGVWLYERALQRSTFQRNFHLSRNVTGRVARPHLGLTETSSTERRTQFPSSYILQHRSRCIGRHLSLVVSRSVLLSVSLEVGRVPVCYRMGGRGLADLRGLLVSRASSVMTRSCGELQDEIEEMSPQDLRSTFERLNVERRNVE